MNILNAYCDGAATLLSAGRFVAPLRIPSPQCVAAPRSSLMSSVSEATRSVCSAVKRSSELQRCIASRSINKRLELISKQRDSILSRLNNLPPSA